MEELSVGPRRDTASAPFVSQSTIFLENSKKNTKKTLCYCIENVTLRHIVFRKLWCFQGYVIWDGCIAVPSRRTLQQIVKSIKMLMCPSAFYYYLYIIYQTPQDRLFSFWPPTHSPSGLSADRGHRYTDTRRKGGRCFHPDRQKLPLQDSQCGLRLVLPRVGHPTPCLPDAVSLRASLCLTGPPARVTHSLDGWLQEKTQRSVAAEPVTFRGSFERPLARVGGGWCRCG